MPSLKEVLITEYVMENGVNDFPDIRLWNKPI